MPKRIKIQIAPELSSPIVSKLRRPKDAVGRRQRRVVWLLNEGKTTNEVADDTRYSVGWVRQIARRYNQTGTVGDRRQNNPGAKPILSHEHQIELYWKIRKGKAPDGGPWNGRKVAQWIKEKTGKDVYIQRGCEYLRRSGFSQDPRRNPEIIAQARSKRPPDILVQNSASLKTRRKQGVSRYLPKYGLDHLRMLP